MQTLNLIFSALLFVSTALSSGAQSLDIFPDYIPAPDANYKECAAILFDGKMLVDDYSPQGKCKVSAGTKGKLTVSEVQLGCQSAKPLKGVGFRVAIKNDRTNTLWMYSPKVLFEVNIQEVLKKCEQGDSILIMTEDQKYSLPHHVIEVDWGC